MFHFKVSAPCSLRLFGGHAGEHEINGMMVAIDLRTTLTFKEISNSICELYIDDPLIHDMLNISLEEFLKFYDTCIKDMKSLNEQVLQLIKLNVKNHPIIVHAFFYLLIYITYKEQIKITAFSMKLFSQFDIDNEYPSASIIVCLVACFFHWSRLQKGVNNTFDDANIKKIYSYATHYGEISSQSGIVDISTCLYGSLTQYQGRCVTHILKNIPSMTILLVDSKQEQYLDAQMQQVADLMNTIPEIVHSIFNSINIITEKACDAFQRLVNIHNDKNLDIGSRTNCISAQHKVLKNCIHINQNLLNSLNISHHLDKICLIARTYGMCGKYTDVSNGRFAYIWCPRHIDEPCTHMKFLEKELTMQRFHVRRTNFTNEGASIESSIENIFTLI